MNIEQAISVACWIIFFLYWTMNFSEQKPSAQKVGTKNKLPSIISSPLAFLLLVMPGWFNLGGDIFARSGMLTFFSILFSVSGISICIWARNALADNWNINIDFKENHELVKAGPYAFVRHPMYTGFLFMAMGSALALLHLGGIIGIVVLFVGCCFRIFYEELLLTIHFPKDYPAYKKQTKALIPFIV